MYGWDRDEEDRFGGALLRGARGTGTLARSQPQTPTQPLQLSVGSLEEQRRPGVGWGQGQWESCDWLLKVGGESPEPFPLLPNLPCCIPGRHKWGLNLGRAVGGGEGPPCR